MKKWLIIIFMVLCPLFLFSDLFYINGISKITGARANIIHSIPISKQIDRLKVILYFYGNFTNGMNKQIVSAYQPRIVPKPTLIKPFRDKLGNIGLIILFNNIKTDIRIESSFMADTLVEVLPIDDFFEYPLSQSSINYVKEYLQGSKLTSTRIPRLKKLSRSLVKSAKTEFDAVISILSWVQNNIHYNPKIVYESAKKTFLKRKGNRKGILNLSLSMLRSAKIPCRFVYGLSINQSYIFQSKNQSINYNISESSRKHILLFDDSRAESMELRYPKSLYQWIEIYFPNRDWVPFDPLSSYFFMPSNFIRRNVSLDSGKNRNLAVYRGKEFPIQVQFFVELSKTSGNLFIRNYSRGGKGYYLFPSLASKEYKRIGKYFKKKKSKEILYEKRMDNRIQIDFSPHTLDFNHEHEQIDIKTSPGYFYSQQVLLSKDMYLNEIQLPLFRFNNSPKGTIWVEIYKTKKDLLLNKNITATSTVLNISDLDNAGKYSWISFLFDSEDESPLLKKGKYWFILKYKTSEMILWRSLFGNPFWKYNDSFYIRQKGSPNLITTYLDLCFRLIGEIKQ